MQMLLKGRHITKLDLFNESDIHSSCLPQRIYDIRQTTDWNISSASVKGKGTLREYWLEPGEIARIKGQSVTPDSESPVDALKTLVDANCEQLGLGLLGGRNYQ